MKKKVYIIIIIALIFIGSFFILVKYSFSEWAKDLAPTRTDEIIKTDSGDEFLFQYEYSDFQAKTSVTIYYNNNNKKVGWFVYDNIPEKVSTITLLNTSTIKCYEIPVYYILIYSLSNGDFQSIAIDLIEEEKPEENPSLIPVCEELVNTQEWRWFISCAKVLKNSGNTEIIEKIKKYSEGIFTKEEIEINKDSGISQDDMIVFSKNF